ncbi:GIY-YIG nuclease family protein [Ponticaulis profundi]
MFFFMNAYFVYILASQRNGTLYTGVTKDLFLRVWQHRNGNGAAFTGRYKVQRLVWFEEHGDINEAILREKRIKRWKRAWKLALIEQENPEWEDLYDERFVV